MQAKFGGGHIGFYFSQPKFQGTINFRTFLARAMKDSSIGYWYSGGGLTIFASERKGSKYGVPSVGCFIVMARSFA